MKFQIGSVVFTIFVVAGLLVGYNAIKESSRTLYQFYYQPDNIGFGCICSHIEGNIWKGSGNDGCGGGNSDRAINLSNNIFSTPSKDNRVYNVTIPAGACCRPQPKVGNFLITGFPGDGCPS